MDALEEKEFIFVNPPAYHFKRAVCFRVAAIMLKKSNQTCESMQMETQAMYEIALGLQALVYQSCVQPA